MITILLTILLYNDKGNGCNSPVQTEGPTFNSWKEKEMKGKETKRKEKKRKEKKRKEKERKGMERNERNR